MRKGEDDGRLAEEGFRRTAPGRCECLVCYVERSGSAWARAAHRRSKAHTAALARQRRVAAGIRRERPEP
ncbi:MAG TPA: hypothetical protein VGE72_30575 [Azospirillum sp.]